MKRQFKKNYYKDANMKIYGSRSTKIFDHKRYKFDSAWTKKRVAVNRAKNLRNSGYLARVEREGMVYNIWIKKVK